MSDQMTIAEMLKELAQVATSVRVECVFHPERPTPHLALGIVFTNSDGVRGTFTRCISEDAMQENPDFLRDVCARAKSWIIQYSISGRSRGQQP